MPAVKQSLTRIWSVAVLVMLSFFHAHAQTTLNDVHVEPRTQSAQPDGLRSLARSATGVIRKTVELVLVPVTVLDGANRIVTGLGPEHFHLYDDKRPQAIKNFWQEDEPVSAGIVLDVSSSMNTKIDRAQDAVMALLKASDPQDEFFLMTFADQPSLLQDFTQNVDEDQNSAWQTRKVAQHCWTPLCWP
jgi:Ca-activated chloride channel family protein